MCVDALNTTTGNSFCKYLTHCSKFSFGIKSGVEKKKNTSQTQEHVFLSSHTINAALNCKLTNTCLFFFTYFVQEQKQFLVAIPLQYSFFQLRTPAAQRIASIQDFYYNI